MYRYEYEYEYSTRIRYWISESRMRCNIRYRGVLDFRITDIRYLGGFGGAKPPRERERGGPDSVEAHPPLSILHIRTYMYIHIIMCTV